MPNRDNYELGLQEPNCGNSAPNPTEVTTGNEASDGGARGERMQGAEGGDGGVRGDRTHDSERA